MTERPPTPPASNDDAAPQALVYSCSGCSSAAQLANHVAVQMDRRGLAEMSCIAGVGGDVPKLVKLARSGRPIIALDGCPLVCVQSVLARHAITPARHYQLHQYGVKKRTHQDFDPAQAQQLLEQVEADLHAHPLTGPTTGARPPDARPAEASPAALPAPARPPAQPRHG